MRNIRIQWMHGLIDRVFLFFRRCLTISKIEHQINEEIRDNEIRLIDDDGSQLGLMSAKDAMDIAAGKGLDLVKIAPSAQPPVCRIMDYGKFRFEQAKKEKEARRNQKRVDIKGIQLSLGIGEHDLDFKLRNAIRFLQDGDKVKATVRFHGREMAHTDLGFNVLASFAKRCEDYAVIEKSAKLEGKNMSMFLAPKVSK